MSTINPIRDFSNLRQDVKKEKIFRKILYYTSGNVNTQIINLLEDGGATRLLFVSNFATHMICGSAGVTHTDLLDAEEIFEVPAVREAWVLTCARSKMLLKCTGFLFTPSKIFWSLRITTSELLSQDKNAVWAMVTYNGGTFQSNLKSATHLVCTSVLCDKYKACESVDRVIAVSPMWIVDCVAAKKLLPHEKYHPRNILPVEDDVGSELGCENEVLQTSGTREMHDKEEHERLDTDAKRSEQYRQLWKQMPWNQKVFRDPTTASSPPKTPVSSDSAYSPTSGSNHDLRLPEAQCIVRSPLFGYNESHISPSLCKLRLKKRRCQEQSVVDVAVKHHQTFVPPISAENNEKIDPSTSIMPTQDIAGRSCGHDPTIIEAWRMPTIQKCSKQIKMNVESLKPLKVKSSKAEPAHCIDRPKNDEKKIASSRMLYGICLSRRCTNISKLMNIISNLGGSVCTDTENANYFVVSQLLLSRNLLLAVCKGLTIVSETWLHDSHKAQHFVDTTAYLPDASHFNKEYGCDLHRSLMTANRNKLFAEQAFYVTPSVVQRAAFVEFIHAAGGTILTEHKSFDDTYVIIAEPKDLHGLKNAVSSNAIICRKKLIAIAILRQSFKVDHFLLTK